MPHIALNSAEPGIRGLLRYRPETARPLGELTEVLLRGPGTLTRGERELIAAYVSALNDGLYCTSSHSAYAAAQLPGGGGGGGAGPRRSRHRAGLCQVESLAGHRRRGRARRAGGHCGARRQRALRARPTLRSTTRC